jgi:outer membrane protein TolC
MRKFIAIIICAFATFGASAQPQTLSLEECLRAGIENNYGVKIARNQAQIAANNVTYAPFLPDLTAGARQQQDRNNERVAYRGSDDVKTDYVTNLDNADLALGWRLFDGMGMFATRETQKELLKEGELNLTRSLEELTVDISSQYYFIVTQQNRLNTAKQYLEISTLRYNQALEKYVIGSISGLEMKQARIDFNADSSKLVLQQQIIRNAYISLFELMNGDLNSRAQLCDTIVPDGSLVSEALLDSAMRHNTAIRMALSGQRLSELDLRIARSILYPTLDFNAAYRYNYNSKSSSEPQFTDYHGPNWGFTLSVPLFRGLETRRKIRNAGIEQQNSQLLYEQTRTGVTSSLMQLFNTYRKNFTMIDFEQESAEAAMANLEAAMEMYRLGSMSGVEFREIQRSYLEAVERKLDAIYNAKISEIGLRYLAGQVL